MENDKEKLIAFIRHMISMPAAEASQVAGYFTAREFTRHEWLQKEKKVCNTYYVMIDGIARAYTTDLQGNDVTTAFYAGGQVVCELFSFFKQVPSRESIQALAPCNTWYISFTDLQTAFHALPPFREFGRAVLVNAYADLKQRMLATLQETAEERYAKLILSQPDIFQFAPLKNIASYLGITDTSLSRIRASFSKKT